MTELQGDDWDLPCSDDELSKAGTTIGKHWVLDASELEELYNKIDNNNGTLNLEWKCPGRRAPSPVNVQKETKAEVPQSPVKEEKSDFDFMDESAESHKKGSSFMKEEHTLAIASEFKTYITPERVINDMVKVRYKWMPKISKETVEIIISFSLSRHEAANQKTIKVNISSLQLNYSEVGIHAPENWTAWKIIGMGTISTENVKDWKIRLFTYDIMISAYEVKIDTMSSKLYTDTDFTDFYLAAGEDKVPVHKNFLVAHSDVFKAMLNGEWKETVEGQIKMPGVTVETLQQLKEYMYLGTVPETGLQSLLLIARCYLIEDLEKHCIRKLAETVKPEDLLSLIEFACENHIQELPFALLQITPDSVVSEAHNLKNKEDKKKRIKMSTNQKHE